jgi:hypothetical protein
MSILPGDVIGVLLKDRIGKRNGKNCSDWLNFYLKYDTLINKNIFSTTETILVLMGWLKI